MASLLQYYRNHQRALLSVLHRKLATRIRAKLRDPKQKAADLANDTRYQGPANIAFTYASLDGWQPTPNEKQAFAALAEMYTAHRFDVLGSGWVDWSYGVQPLGIEGHSYEVAALATKVDAEGSWLSQVVLAPHLDTSKQLWQQAMALNPSYQPIDWQRDAKSGFRWSAQHWYKNMAGFHAGKPGADIKVPWELARMHHLVRLACAAHAQPENASAYVREFMCQVLDFAATNPVRMGVNWAMPMDVGIRVANLLLAYDLFRAVDTEKLLDGPFATTFARLVWEHGNHLVHNMELKEGLAGNHYLANLAGLLFAASYLQASKETDQWYAYALQELTFEVDLQFFVDGCNFEASTAYHALGTDLVVWSAALALGTMQGERFSALDRYRPDGWPGRRELRERGRNPFAQYGFPRRWRKRMARMGRILEVLTKPNGEIPQVGDNDSGRLFFLTPMGQFRSADELKSRYANMAAYAAPRPTLWDESLLNYTGVREAVRTLFADESPASGDLCSLERTLIRHLSGGQKLPSADVEDYYLDFVNGNTTREENRLRYRHQWLIERPAGASMDVDATGLEGLGLFVFRAADFHLTVIGCAAEDQMYHWSHVHNDKGAFDLYQGGQNVLADPGSYLYGALPEWRNKFRANQAHATINCFDEPQNRWVPNHSVFLVLKDVQCEVLKFHHQGITIKTEYGGVIHVRSIRILEQSIEITDFCNRKFAQHKPNFELYAAGYGKRLNPPA